MIDVVNGGGEQSRADFDFLEGVFQIGGVKEDVRGLHDVGRVHVVVVRVRRVIFPLQSRQKAEQYAFFHF